MPVTMTLADAYAQIMAAASGRLDAATAAGQSLDDVRGVVTSDRARARPKPPYLWLMCEDISVDTGSEMAMHEHWNAVLAVSGWVVSDDPEAGELAADDLTMRARSVLLADRRLGLPFVDDVTSKNVLPAGPDLQKGTSHVAVARLNVRFLILEP